MNKLITRRQALVSGVKIAAAVAPASLLFACGQESSAISQQSSPSVDLSQAMNKLDTRLHQELIGSSKAASAGGKWTELEFNNLIDSMGEDSLKRMCKTLDVSSASVEQYISNPLMKTEIKKDILDASRFLPGGNPDEILYHQDVLQPTAFMMDVDETIIDTYDTLSLERVVYNKVFEGNWASLNENERINFLSAANWDIEPNKIVGLAALTGASIFVGLAEVVKLTGFSFYAGMSNGLYALASGAGLVLPFSAYMGASTAIALATGPVGWVAAAILAGTGLYFWITSNESTAEADLLTTVLHMHHYKISAMQEAGLEFSVRGA